MPAFFRLRYHPNNLKLVEDLLKPAYQILQVPTLKRGTIL